VVAIGETGLDYYQMEERKGGRSVADLEWQRDRFRTHIRAARQCGKPLIIHTRASSADTVAILKEEGEDGSPAARRRLPLLHRDGGSGAGRAGPGLHDLVLRHPHLQERGGPARGGEVRAADRLLIETDSPYLAPVPYRGKVNNPSYVPYVAAQLAEVRGVPWKRSRPSPAPISSACSPGSSHEKSLQVLVYLVLVLGFLVRECRLLRRLLHGHQADDPGTIEALLKRGFDPNTVDPAGNHGLFIALQGRPLKAAEVLMASPKTKVEWRSGPRTKAR
jgi:hypothetical protein